MEPIGHDGQIVPFSRSNIPRVASFLLKIFMDVRQELNYGVDVRQDLSYGVGWSRWVNRPIFNVKRSPERTLAMEPVGHDGNSGPFSKSNNPRSVFPASFLPKFLWTSVKTLALDPIGHDGRLVTTGNLAHFQGQTIFRVCKDPVLPILTLVMEPVGHNRQTGPFLESNDHRSGFSASFLLKYFMDVRQNLSYRAGWSRRANWPNIKVKQAPERILAMEPICHDGQTDPFSRSNEPRAGKPPVLPIFTLAMEPIDHDGQIGPFSRSNDPRSGLTHRFANFCLLYSMDFVVIQIFGVIFAKNFHGRLSRPELWSRLVTTDLSYGSDWSRRVNQRIFKVKRAPERLNPMFCRFSYAIFMDVLTSIKTLAMEQVGSGPIAEARIKGQARTRADFRYYFAKNFHGRPSRPELWSWFVTTDKPVHFLGQANPGTGKLPILSIFAYQPIFKVKRAAEQLNSPFCQFLCAIVHGYFGDPDFRCHFCLNISWTSVKTLAMELVGPYKKIGPFLRFSMSFFPKNFMDIRQDLNYGAGWSRPANRHIFKVKRSPERTLAMESVGPEGQTDPFSRSNDPRNRFLMSFLPKIFMDVRQDLSYGAGWPRQVNQPIFKVKRSLERTLVMELVGSNWKIGPFSRSNEPRSLPKIFIDFHHDFSYGASWSKCVNRPIFNVKQAPDQANPKFINFRVLYSMDYLVIQIFDVIFAESFHGHSSIIRYGAGWSRWVNRPIFKVKRASERTLAMELVGPYKKIGPFQGGRAAAVHGCFDDPDFRCHFSKNFMESIKTLTMERFGQSKAYFQGQTIPRADLSYGVGWSEVKPTFSGQRSTILNDLRYGAGWSRRANRPIFKVKRYEWADLSYGADWSRRVNRPIFKTLVMEPIGSDWKIGPFSRSNEPRSLPKIFMDFHHDFIYGASWSKRVNRPIFNVKQAPDQANPKFINFRVLYSINYLVIQIFDVIFAESFHGHSSIHKVWSWLVTMGKPAHFQGQTSLGADFGRHFLQNIFINVRQDLSFGADWSRRANCPIFMVKRYPERSPGAGKSPILSIFVCYNPWILGDPNSRRRFCLNFSWTSVKTLTMEPVGHDGKTYQFSRSVEPRADLSYGADWTRRENRPISKSIDILVIRISVVIFAKNFHRRPSRPSLWSWFVTTVKPTYFQGQTSPGACKPPILPIFVCHCPWMFWLFGFTASFLLKTFKVVCQDLSYGVDWSRQVIRPIFKVKRSPERVSPPFCQFSCAIFLGCFGDPDIRRHFYQKIFIVVRQDLSFGADLSQR
ncbi:hypothetical protein H5410_058948 [Solanum commersonii]|uniref:Uncharacterized protein n=1 Tax=Solanum commersonii TaxID=4109 RepID=A0A9J5W1Z7_SOLCO|nr:hypothetical protein H5410_058948 [Solanum commersonii]